MSYVIFGAGGFGAEVYNWLGRIDVAAFYAETSSKKELFGVPIITDLVELLWLTNIQFITAVGDPNLKEKFNNKALSIGLQPCRGFIYQNVVWGIENSLGDNSIICPNTTVTTRVKIGYGCTVNIHCTIGHDAVIGDFTTLHPDANISGNVEIGKRVVVGCNACIREKIKIVDDVIIGMGSVVIKDILESGVYVGNPLKKIR